MPRGEESKTKWYDKKVFGNRPTRNKPSSGTKWYDKKVFPGLGTPVPSLYTVYVPEVNSMAAPPTTTPVVPNATAAAKEMYQSVYGYQSPTGVEIPRNMYQSVYGYGYQSPTGVAAPMGTQGMTGVNSGTPMLAPGYSPYSGPQYGQPETYPGMRPGGNAYAGITPPGPAAPAGPAMPQSWEDRFYAEHGRYPDEDDVNDRLWSESFYRDNGRPPNMDEWTYHYYETHGFPGGGGAAGSAATPETLGNLSWWASAEALPANLRGWGSWLREMVEQNKGINISNPFYRTGKAGQEAITDVADRGKPLAGYGSSNDVLGQLRALLGIQAAAGDNNTTVWQKIINALPSASLEAQQLINSLRYDSNTNQWYSIDTTQLVNPSYT